MLMMTICHDGSGYYRGLAYFFYGVSLWEKDDHGTGIGLLQQVGGDQCLCSLPTTTL